MRAYIQLLAVSCLVTSVSVATAQDQEGINLAERGQAILKTYCYNCHGKQFLVEGFDVLDRERLISDRGDEIGWVVPGKPDESLLWMRADVDGGMPPKKAKQPTAEEREILKQWILAGAPFPENAERPFKGQDEILRPIRDDLLKQPLADRPFQKYFVFTQFYNNSKYDLRGLRQAQAALSKLVNSLSWKRQIVLPRAIDRDGTVFALDLRSVGWDRIAAWDEVRQLYPYGLDYAEHKNQDTRELAAEVVQLSSDDLPFIRADWFIATASRPPLYHKFMQIPDTVEPLRSVLNVNTRSDFIDNLLVRAGFTQSGVSDQNRVADRHHSLYGYYWESYDFKPRGERSDIMKFPLGPDFDGNKFSEHAFKHDGGEIIFSLPNGLQGYMLVDAEGNRIDAGPTEVVTDKLSTSGTVSIVNGLSCMACHQHGVKRFKDAMRDGRAVVRDAMVKLQNLVPKQEEMDQILDRDEDRFLASLEQVAGPFLKVGADANRDIRDFPEPVGAVASLYVTDMGPEDVALDLGIEDSRGLQYIVRGNLELRKRGLGPLIEGNVIKREIWSSLSSEGISPFHLMSEQLEQGTALAPENE